MKKLLFLLLLSSSIYAQSLWKDKNSLLSPTGSRGIGAPSLYGFSIGDTSIIRLRSGAVQFLNGGSWYAIPVPSNYVLYSDSVTKYMTPTSFLSAFDTRLGTKSTTNLVEGTNLYYLDSRARASISSSATGLTYTNTTGIFSWTSGYSGLTDSMRTLWSGKQTYYTNLSSIGALANATGWLKNDGSGNFSYSTPSRTDLGFGTMALVDSVLFRSEMAGLYVPQTRTINGYDLSANRSLAYSDLTSSAINIGTDSISAGAGEFKTSSTSLPPLGTKLIHGFNILRSDANVGLNIGYLSSTGDFYIQNQRNDLAIAYNIDLQPNGGSVWVGYTSDPTSGNTFAVNGNSYFNGTGTFTGLLTGVGLYSTTTLKIGTNGTALDSIKVKTGGAADSLIINYGTGHFAIPKQPGNSSMEYYWLLLIGILPMIRRIKRA